MAKKIIIYLGHPAHYQLFKNVIQNLSNKGHEIKLIISKKEILEDLLNAANIEYQNIHPENRQNNFLNYILKIIKRNIRLYRICKEFKPDLLVGTSVENSHISKLLRIPSINVNEDDSNVVPLYANLSYPWASVILNPVSCSSGRWEHKAVKYNGFHELAYLHPNQFTPDINIVKKYVQTDDPLFLIRFSKLAAHHDVGIRGLNNENTLNIISILKPHGKVLITSEKEIAPNLDQFRIDINPLDIHHLLAYSKIFISDSQTMSAEAGILGTPFIRYNDFVGRIGYLNEIEQKYELGFGFRISEITQLYDKLIELIHTTDIDEVFKSRKEKLLSDKIDVAKFLTWFINNYPNSYTYSKANPNSLLRFR